MCVFVYLATETDGVEQWSGTGVWGEDGGAGTWGSKEGHAEIFFAQQTD